MWLLPAWVEVVALILVFPVAFWLRAYIWAEHRGHPTPTFIYLWIYRELRDWWQGKRPETYADTRGAADRNDWTRLP